MLARPDEQPGLAIVVEAPDVRLRYVLEPLAIGVKGLRPLVVGDRSGLPIAWVGRGPKTLAATAMATRTLSAAQKVTTALDLPSPEAMRRPRRTESSKSSATDSRPEAARATSSP